MLRHVVEHGGDHASQIVFWRENDGVTDWDGLGRQTVEIREHLQGSAGIDENDSRMKVLLDVSEITGPNTTEDLSRECQ